MRINKIDLKTYQLVVNLFDKYRIFYKQASNLELANDFIRERIINNESVIFVAQNTDNVPMGFTQLYPIFSSVRATKNWLLNDLYVDSPFRKQGIGEALIKKAMDFAKGENASYLKLETAEDNYTAQSLYEAIGFIKESLLGGYFTYKMSLQS